MDASTASLWGPVYQGMVRTRVAGAPEARTTARPRSSSARLETSAQRGWQHRRCVPCALAGSGWTRICRRRWRRSVAVVANEVRECAEKSFFSDAAAKTLTLAADQIFRMLASPQSSTPWDHDCRMPVTIRPLEPYQGSYEIYYALLDPNKVCICQ